MNIAIPAEHANIDQLTGVEHYTRELILALARIDRRNNYTLYLRTTPGDWCYGLPRNFVTRVIPARIAWTQLRVSREILRQRPDALLVTSFSMPLIHPRNSVVTIHDLAWHLFPESIRTRQRWWLFFTHYVASRFARRLIAVSQQTKKDMVDILKVQPHKVKVIHHGFSGDDAAQRVPATASALTPSANADPASPLFQLPFILCLGTLQPRKNLVRMIDAFLSARDRGALPHTLVLAGRLGWMCDDLLRKISASPGVLYLGYVKDRLGLLRAADLLVQPAIYEGFGLSLLDAFSQGVPVACSNVSSLPEIAGDAAELFDPYNSESIASAILNVVTNPDRADQLRRRGSERLDSFSWDECARKTLAVLESGAAPDGVRSGHPRSFDPVPG